MVTLQVPVPEQAPPQVTPLVAVSVTTRPVAKSAVQVPSLVPQKSPLGAEETTPSCPLTDTVSVTGTPAT